MAGFQGASRIEADLGGCGNQGIIRKARILDGILDHENLVFVYGMAAKRDIAGGLRKFEPQPGFKPLTIFIDKRYQDGRHVENPRR